MKTPHRSGHAANPFPALLSLALLAVTLVFTGCYASGGGGYVSGSVALADTDDYIYYPGYEVYYSNRHHQYFYRDGNSWVRRSEPPRTFVRNAPSVHMDFHDSPEHHHAEVVRRYPKTWRQSREHQDRDHDRDRDER